LTANDIEFPPSNIDFYDALGQQHTLQVQWIKDSYATDNNTWRMKVTSSDPAMTVTAPAADVDIPLTIDFPGPAASTVNMNLNLGKFGVASQTTMFGSDGDLEFRSANGDGLPPGSFRNLEIGTFGELVVNYSNGARRSIFQVPVAQFSNPNGLKLENGNGYSATAESGLPSFVFPGTSGAGTLVASAVEGSNVDIAAEFTKMIQTQRAYGANTRVITVTSQLLEETNNIIR
jgi:flagellar hook protein FlgE